MSLAQLIATAQANRPAPIQALRHDGGILTATRPQKFTCSDAALYNVKFVQNNHGDGRGCFNEQVAALCGALLAAPVPRVALIEVDAATAAILDRDRAMLNIDFTPQPGIHHGSRWANNHSDRALFDHVQENRQRFGALEILYTWLTCSGDHQFIYSNVAPYEVLSVDHTTFFPGGFGWNSALLSAQRDQTVPDPMFTPLGLEDADRSPALDRLAQVTEQSVAGVVARAPDSWGVSSLDRLAAAEFLIARKNALIAHYRPSTP